MECRLLSLPVDAKVLAVIAATSELATPDDADGFLDAMPIPELASMWRALQRLSRCDQISGVWVVLMYFNRLSHRRPDRARDLAREVLRAETGEPMAMQPNDKLMLALFYAHGAEMVDRIETEAEQDFILPQRLGGTHL